MAISKKDVLAYLGGLHKKWTVSSSGQLINEDGDCLLCAIANDFRNKKVFKNTSYRLAANEIGLPSNEAEEIIRLTDFAETRNNSTFGRELLAACNVR